MAVDGSPIVATVIRASIRVRRPCVLARGTRVGEGLACGVQAATGDRSQHKTGDHEPGERHPLAM
jgi:hypothetical protein